MKKTLPLVDEAGEKAKIDVSKAVTLFRSNERSFWILAGIAAVGLLLRVGHWNLSPYSDECKYLSHAFYLFGGNKPEWFDPAVASRVWYLMVLGLWGSLVGFDTFRLQALSLGWYLCNFLLIYHVGKRFSGTKAACLAAVMYSFLPLDVLHSTAAATDQPGVTFALLGVAIWSTLFGQGGPKVVLAFWLGFVTTVAVTVRQPLIFLFGVLIVDAVLRGLESRSVWRVLGGITLGGMSAVLLQSLVHFLWLGDPWYGLRTNIGIMTNLEGSADFLRGIGYFKVALNSLGDFGVLGLIIILLIPSSFRGRGRDSKVLGWALALYVAYHLGGTVSLREWVVPWISSRYLMPAVVLAFVLVSSTALDMMSRLNRLSQAFAVGALIGSSLLALRAMQRPGVSELVWQLPRVCQEVGKVYFPDSARQYFVPFDRQEGLSAVDLVSDDFLRREATSPGGVPVVIPEAPYYKYKHIGVMDAFLSRPEKWKAEPIKAPTWPPYWYLLTGYRDRTVGWLFIPRA